MKVWKAGPDDWRSLRSLRLQALQDAPDAFASTWEDEAKMPDAKWRGRLASKDHATFLVSEADNDYGLAVGGPYGDDAGLYAMWIAPAFRGRGGAGKLIEAVAVWAAEKGFRRLLLDVADANNAAISLYERHGFSPTGHRSCLPAPREHIKEHQRARELTS